MWIYFFSIYYMIFCRFLEIYRMFYLLLCKKAIWFLLKWRNTYYIFCWNYELHVAENFVIFIIFIISMICNKIIHIDNLWQSITKTNEIKYSFDKKTCITYLLLTKKYEKPTFWNIIRNIINFWLLDIWPKLSNVKQSIFHHT